MNNLELDLEFDPIYKAYPNCTGINSEGKAFDKDGTEIVIDQDLIESTKNTMQAEYAAQEYARNRQEEYPSIADLVVALYDTDDKSAIETKRAAVKAKYPKP